jgi:aryl-alcohol dehydrogenase-like predicted oxidoreductase
MTSTTNTGAAQSAAASGTFSIGGDLPVHRLGYGAMQLPGAGIWGPSKDRANAVTVLRRVPELGINLIDTADSYGPHVADELIAEALAPYAPGLVVATKAGLERPGPNRWEPNGRPEHLRASAEASLTRLKVERIDLFQLHRIDSKVPAEDQFGVLAELQREGKVRHLGLSEVSVAEIESAGKHFTVATVQNRYNVADREHEAVLDYCTEHGIGFIPWFPLATGKLAQPGSPLARAAERLGATPAQVALAWLLRRSPVMLPIPGTSSVSHLEENVAAVGLTLSDEEFESISKAA